LFQSTIPEKVPSSQTSNFLSIPYAQGRDFADNTSSFDGVRR